MKLLKDHLIKHTSLHTLTDKVSEFVLGGATLTGFYLYGKNGFTGDRINRYDLYEIGKFLSGCIFLYLQITALLYLWYHGLVMPDIVSHRYYTITTFPAPFNPYDALQAIWLYATSQVLYRGAYLRYTIRIFMGWG